MESRPFICLVTWDLGFDIERSAVFEIGKTNGHSPQDFIYQHMLQNTHLKYGTVI